MNHLPKKFYLCKGDSMTLPNFGFSQINTNNYLLIKVKADTLDKDYPCVLEDQTTTKLSFKENEQKDLVVGPLEAGGYILYAKTNPHFQMHLSVLDAEKFSDGFFVNENSVIKVNNDSHNLTINNSTYDEKNRQLKLKIASSKLDSTKVHLFLSNFYSNEKFSEMVLDSKSLCPDVENVQTFEYNLRNNAYASEAVLSDEMKYVYDRRNKENFMGNTLEKPLALLKRELNGGTKTTEEV